MVPGRRTHARHDKAFRRDVLERVLRAGARQQGRTGIDPYHHRRRRAVPGVSAARGERYPPTMSLCEASAHSTRLTRVAFSRCPDLVTNTTDAAPLLGSLTVPLLLPDENFRRTPGVAARVRDFTAATRTVCFPTAVIHRGPFMGLAPYSVVLVVKGGELPPWWHGPTAAGSGESGRRNCWTPSAL